jgi:hypothetical protein
MNVSARSFLIGGIAVVCASPRDTAADSTSAFLRHRRGPR